MSQKKVTIAGLVATLIGFGAEVTAAPAEVPCRLTEPGSLEIDGLLDDWGRAGKKSAGDGALEVKCAYDSERVYLAVRVYDSDIVRRSKGGEDGLSVTVGDSIGNPIRFTFYPATVAVESRMARTKGVEALDSLQPDGWSLEVSAARSLLPEWGPAVPGLSFRIMYRDVDRDRQGSEENGRYGTLTLSGAEHVYQALLKAAGLRPAQVKTDVIANVVSWPGRERIIAGGSVFGVLSDEYVYIRLPVTAAEDVLRVQVLDLFGTGQSAIMTHYRQHGNGGSRELVRVWRVTSRGTFESVVTLEVSKRLGQNQIANRWEFIARKSRKDPGYDLMIEAADAQGFTEATFREAPAPDAVPILLPWAAERKIVHRFDSNGYFGTQSFKRSR